MKRIMSLIAGGAVAAAMSGCIVAPAPGYRDGPEAYQPPAGVVYVAPTYAAPGPGWGWRYHAQYGWGWYHPHQGWHRGWR
ncbi:MAG: hypothetical protein ABW032_10400 [Burkholderiaceae bacterium]